MSSARIEELRKKFDENPRRYFAPLANEYRKVGDFDQAIFICQEYLPQQPGHMSGHIVFGQALFEAKRLPEAKSVFETALSLDPENLIALRHLADITRDLGDFTSAKGWYDRVLQADPRNEEVQAIVANLGKGGTGAVAAASAPTAETPAKGPATKTLPGAAHAPTIELSAKAVQELLKARQAGKPAEPKPAETKPAEAKAPAAPAAVTEELKTIEIAAIDLPAHPPMNLDTTPTVEIRASDVETAPMEGLEPTHLGGTMDLPTIEPLGLEGNAAPGMHAEPAAAPAPLDGLDTIPLDIDVPAAPPAEAAPSPATMEIPAVPTAADDGLLDLGSFGAPTATPEPVAAAPSAVETPIDGGHESGDLLDLDFLPPAAPAAPPPEPAAVPTMIMDAVKAVVPVVQDAVESAAPALMDFVDTTIPAVVETVKSTVEAVAEAPTVVMEAITVPSRAEPPAPRTSQSVPFVTETMAQLYLSQGHRAEAIDIYRKLIDARPNDAELKSRLAAIEAEVVGGTPAPRTAEFPAVKAAASAPPPPRFTGTGPSIRTVLRELFGLDGSVSYATSSPAPAPSLPAEVGSIDMLFSTDAVATGLDPLAAAFDGGYVAARGTIDEVFAGGAQ